MGKLRDIVDVYKKIDEIIPSDNIEFKQKLNDFIDSIFNLAPEVRRSKETYIPFLNILIKYIPNLFELAYDEPIWKFYVKNIFSGKTNL